MVSYRRKSSSPARAQFLNGVFSAGQRCPFFVGERSVSRRNARARVRRAYLQGGLVETRGSDGGSGDLSRQKRGGRNRKRGLRACERSHAGSDGRLHARQE